MVNEWTNQVLQYATNVLENGIHMCKALGE